MQPIAEENDKLRRKKVIYLNENYDRTCVSSGGRQGADVLLAASYKKKKKEKKDERKKSEEIRVEKN